MSFINIFYFGKTKKVKLGKHFLVFLKIVVQISRLETVKSMRKMKMNLESDKFGEN